MGRSTIIAFLAAAAVATTSCKDDKPPAWDQRGADPWAGGSPGDSSGGDGGDAMAGLGADPMQMIKNVVENLQKPGPYEAPTSSPGFDGDQPHLAVLTLAGAVAEQESFSWLEGMSDSLVLRVLIDRVRALAADDTVAGVLLRVDDVSASLPDMVELRAALAELRAKGKSLACHTEGAGNVGYLILTACERIGLAPTGEITLSGPAAMPIHLKGLLDQLGITADFLHVGAYKGAAEPLTRDRPSKEMEETLGAILDRAYATMVATVASGRGLTEDQVKALIDEAVFTADKAVAARLVDEVATFERFRDGLAGERGWTRVQVEPKDDQMASMMKLMRFFGAIPTERPDQDHVAVVYAVGDVVDGEGDGAIGARGEIASRTLVPALRTLTKDDSVKAVVLRIDSGGGSALASELIWHAVAELKAAKPVVVSMSDVAASGGYYIACGATRIFALDDTLTGSIGVVGGKLALGGTMNKLGVTAFPMGRGKRATMMTSPRAWTADERAVVQATMESVYEVFLSRVAAGRGKTRDQIHAIAQGRVWTGAKAKELGLIDEIGGLDAAIAEARELGGVDTDAPLEIYPGELTLRDIIGSFGEVSAPFGLGSSGSPAATALAAVARDLSPHAAQVVERTLRQVARFRDARVQAVALLPVVFE